VPPVGADRDTLQSPQNPVKHSFQSILMLTLTDRKYTLKIPKKGGVTLGLHPHNPTPQGWDGMGWDGMGWAGVGWAGGMGHGRGGGGWGMAGVPPPAPTGGICRGGGRGDFRPTPPLPTPPAVGYLPPRRGGSFRATRRPCAPAWGLISRARVRVRSDSCACASLQFRVRAYARGTRGVAVVVFGGGSGGCL